MITLRNLIKLFFLFFLFALQFSCLNKQEINRADANAVVKINTRHNSFGSGFFINDSLIVTNYHVIKDDYKPTYYLGKDSINKYKTQGVFYYNEAIDLALLLSEKKSSSWLEIAEALPNINSLVYNVSNPLGKQFVFFKGYIKDTSAFYYKLRLPVKKGSSGSALLNNKGKVIGVICKRFHGEEESCQAINLKHLNDFMSESAQPRDTLSRQVYLTNIMDILFDSTYSSFNRINKFKLTDSLQLKAVLNKIKMSEKMHKLLVQAPRYHLKLRYLSITEWGQWVMLFNNGLISYSTMPIECSQMYSMMKSDLVFADCITFNDYNDWMIISKKFMISNRHDFMETLNALTNKHGDFMHAYLTNEECYVEFEDGFQCTLDLNDYKLIF